jgi:hypothetical protein
VVGWTRASLARGMLRLERPPGKGACGGPLTFESRCRRVRKISSCVAPQGRREAEAAYGDIADGVTEQQKGAMQVGREEESKTAPRGARAGRPWQEWMRVRAASS